MKSIKKNKITEKPDKFSGMSDEIWDSFHEEEDSEEKSYRNNHYIPIHYLSDPSIMENFTEFILHFDK